MKKVINGKMYNTESARCVHDWYNGLFTNDFHYLERSLYLKKTGEFFLYSFGGLMTGCNGERKIKPLSIEEAKAYVEKNCDGELYEELFGEIKEDDTKIKLNIGIAADAAAKIKRAAQERGMSLGDYITLKCVDPE